MSKKIFLSEPSFSGNEKKYLNDCIDSGWVSSAGNYVSKFEESIASYTGAKHAIAMVNGTASIHLALKMAGVDSGHEVIAPTLTFIAPINAIKYVKSKNGKILCIVGRKDGYAALNSDCKIVISSNEKRLLTPISESYQAVIWHLIISHPELQLNKTKW